MTVRDIYKATMDNQRIALRDATSIGTYCARRQEPDLVTKHKWEDLKPWQKNYDVVLVEPYDHCLSIFVMKRTC